MYSTPQKTPIAARKPITHAPTAAPFSMYSPIIRKCPLSG